MLKLKIHEYTTADGKSPYKEWLDSLDRAVRARIQARIFRFELGNLGDHKAVGKGVLEARIQFGIKKAQAYWESYLEGRENA